MLNNWNPSHIIHSLCCAVLCYCFYNIYSSVGALVDCHCPHGWIQRPASDSCYKFVTAHKATYDAAQASCHQMHSRLATLETDEEISWLYGYLYYTPGLRNTIWIGGRKTGAKWFWDDGDANNTEIAITDWAPGQPNNSGGNQNCLAIFVQFRGNPDELLKWDDGTCSVALNYVCEQ